MKRYDLISLGEPLLRFSPPGRARLEDTDTLDVRVVGSQLNVAADCARLGLRTAFLTQLPDSPLGDLAWNRIRGYGVDPSGIRRIANSRMGSTYVEFSISPRVPRAVYDRADSAASRIDEAGFDWAEAAADSEMLYTDGILPALSAGCRRAAGAFFRAGKRAGCRNCFDLNFRRHLWTAAEARQCWAELLPLADVAVTNRNVCEEVFGYRGSDGELAERFAREFGIGLVAFTSRGGEGDASGSWHARLRTADGENFEDTVSFGILDRYGTGDAWFAGLLTGLAQGRTIPEALRFAGAVIALAHTTFGDVIECSAGEAEALMRGESGILKR